MTIEDITIWSPDHTKIFSSEQIEVASAYGLVRGNLIFDKVHIAGVDFHLIQDKGQLNIQFIFDAFQSGGGFLCKSWFLLFKSIQLDSIHFKFTSIKNQSCSMLI